MFHFINNILQNFHKAMGSIFSRNPLLKNYSHFDLIALCIIIISLTKFLNNTSFLCKICKCFFVNNKFNNESKYFCLSFYRHRIFTRKNIIHYFSSCVMSQFLYTKKIKSPMYTVLKDFRSFFTYFLH